MCLCPTDRNAIVLIITKQIWKFHFDMPCFQMIKEADMSGCDNIMLDALIILNKNTTETHNICTNDDERHVKDQLT